MWSKFLVKTKFSLDVSTMGEGLLPTFVLESKNDKIPNSLCPERGVVGIFQLLFKNDKVPNFLYLVGGGGGGVVDFPTWEGI